MVGMLSRIRSAFGSNRRLSAQLAEQRRTNAFLRSYNRRIKARYDAAGLDPELERYWSQADNRSPRSANEKGIRSRLRERSRYECQESNSFARGMLVTKVNDVIGTGPQLKPTTPNAELNRAIRQRWNEWSRSINLPRILRSIETAKIGDGEGFGQRSTNPRSKHPVKLDILVTEADLWTEPFGDGLERKNYVDGITYDEYGKPVSYKRLNSHPGDQYDFSGSLEFETLDSSEVIHWFSQNRPDQRRGIPDFTPAIPLFAELRRYRLAVITAAEVAADFSAVMYSDANAFNENPDEIDDDFLTIDLERRAMMTLPAGWKIQQLRAEQPTTAFAEFTDNILGEIGRCVQMPLNLVSGTSRDYNFASGRLDYLLYWQHCDVERCDFEREVMDRIFGWWLEEALLTPGYLPDFGSLESIAHEWVWPERRPIDEVKAAQAAKIRWELGHLTDEQWADSQQIDLAAHYDNLETMIETRSAMGAPIPTAQPATLPSSDDETMSEPDGDQQSKTSKAKAAA